MKKILLALSIIAATSSFSQSINSVVTMTGSGDTLVNTTADNVLYPITAGYENISIEAVVTKISGTVAGTAILQGSIDGVNYKDLNTDTLTLTNVTTNKYIWAITFSPYKYYKINYVGVGTMSAKIYGYIFTNGQSTTATLANLTSTYSNAIDTVTNSATNTVTLRVKSWYKTIVIQPVITKISGTVGGTVTVQGSNDGTNYTTVSSSYSDAQTLTPTNQTTNTKLFKITGSPYAYYRVSYTGTGTMSAKLRAYFFGQK